MIKNIHLAFKNTIFIVLLLSFVFTFSIQEGSTTLQPILSQQQSPIGAKTLEKLRWQIRKNAQRPQLQKKLPILSEALGDSSGLIEQDDLNGNMLIIDNYALFSKNTNGHPTIQKLNLVTMELSTLEYPQISKFGIHQSLVLADLRNGDIALGGGEYIIIIDKNSFNLKQVIKGQFKDSNVLKFNIYIDDDSAQRIIVQRGSFSSGVQKFHELKKLDGSQGYTQVFLTYSPYASWAILVSFQQTSYNRAASVQGYDISYWQNLNSIIDISYDRKYLFGQVTYVATSKSQKYVAIRNSQMLYQIYRIDDSFELQLQKSLNISYDQHNKAQFTSDETQFFVSSRVYRSNRIVSKANIETGIISKITDTDSLKSHTDFHLFAKQTDRMIVLAVKKDIYYLQLRAISDLRLIHEISLTFSFEVVSQKLMGTTQWGFNFNLASATIRGFIASRNSIMTQFTVIDDKIVKSQLQELFYFQSLKSCNKYFVNLDPYTKNIQVRHYSNFSVMKTIEFSDYYYIATVNDYLALGSQPVTLYDLSKSLEPLGVFFKSNERLYYQLNLMLPKRGIYIDLTTVQYFSDSIMRAIYNISIPQIKNTKKINDVQLRIGGQIYFEPYPNSPCNKVYYLQFDGKFNSQTDALLPNSSPHFVEYDECSKTASKYPIQFEDNWQARLLFSSDKKYFIIVMEQYIYDSNNFYMEIRARENLSEIVLKTEFSLGKFYNKESIVYFDVDLINDSQIIVKSNNFVYTTNISLKQKSNNLQMNN